MCTAMAPKSASPLPVYNVVCRNCNHAFKPTPRSPLWWQADRDAKDHPDRLDAMTISGEKCGCIKKPRDPDAPYRVVGFTDLLEDFDIPFHNFISAVRCFRRANCGGATVFITGVCKQVKWRLA